MAAVANKRQAVPVVRFTETCTVEIATAEAMAVAQTIRALMHREGAKVPPGVRELMERVAKQMISGARVAMTGGAR